MYLLLVRTAASYMTCK